MLKRISLILLIIFSLGYAKTDFELAGEAMVLATEQKAKYEALNHLSAKKDETIMWQSIELFVDKVLLVAIIVL